VVNETTVPQPWNPYERSKLAAEIALRERARALGMEYVILRPTAVYGPRDDRLLKLFRSAARGRFPLFGSGDGRRHMVYVSDVAAAFLRACIEKRAANQDMIIAGPQAVSLRRLLTILAKVVQRPRCGPQLPLWPMLYATACVENICNSLGIKPPIYRRRMDFYLHDTAFDCTRARQTLGWKPEVDLEEGLARTLRAYQLDNLADMRAIMYPLAFLIPDQTCLWDLAAFAALAV
jgi:nucleoside-diphosphate-sugar epimerase